MIVDTLLKILKKDPLVKRNIVKTVSWRIVGSIDTVLLVWIISGQIGLSVKIGIAELLTKIILYYLHERVWQKNKFGLPSRRQQSKLIQSEIKPNLFKQAGKINRENREKLNNNKSFTLWFTGLSGSGKSTLASETESWLYQQQRRLYILDGDNTRLGINNDLSFSDEDRTENIRRVAEICKLFNDAGIIVIASFISPFEQDRQMAKKLIGDESFVEVFVDASLELCQKRDPKGLYKLALGGKIRHFTGVDSPYEKPQTPDIHLLTGKLSIKDCILCIKGYLIENKHIMIKTVSEIDTV